MKLKIKDSQLWIETNIYQARNGAVYINWSNTVIKLEKDCADSVVYEIPNFDIGAYKKYYKITQ